AAVWTGGRVGVGRGFWGAGLRRGTLGRVLGKLGPDAPDPGPTAGSAPTQTIRIATVLEMPAAFWGVLAVTTVFMLGRYSEAFLVLSALDHGLPAAFSPLVLVMMNVVYAVAAYPVGRLSDQLGRWSLLGIGVLVMVAADLALEFAQALSLVAVGVMLWGLHMALTQGILTALVADSVTPRLRGTAFGF